MKIAFLLLSVAACQARPTPTPTPTAPAQQSTIANHCSGGNHRGLDAQLTPAQVAGDRLELRLDLTTHLEGSARARWAVEITDDVGTPVRAPVLAAPVMLGGHGATRSEVLATPAGLADGFYVVRVTAVAKAGEASDAAVLERYLEVRDREITPIESDEYFARSRAQMGVEL